MSMYVWILVWIGAAGILASTGKLDREEIVNSVNVKRMRPLFAFLFFVPVIIWTGYRGYIGDTAAYIRTFSDMPYTLSELPLYFGELEKDKGFYMGSALIKCMIGNNVNLYFMILALLQSAFLLTLYRKYSVHYVLSCFLFLSSTDYISWMFNGIRQFMAVAITLAAFPFVLRRKYILAVLIVLVASTMHGTALLVLPFVFIVQGEAWNKRTVAFIVSVIVILAFIDQFTNILDALLQETQYQNVVSDWQNWQDDGTNILRVLVYSVPAVFSLLGLKCIRNVNTPLINICTNMSIIATGFYVVSIFTSGIFIGRLPIYFSLYNYILLPWEIDNIFNEKSARFIYFMLVISYVSFYLYSIRTMGL